MHSAFAMPQWGRRGRNHFRGKGARDAEEVNELLGGAGRVRERVKEDAMRRLFDVLAKFARPNIPISTGGPTGHFSHAGIVKTFFFSFCSGPLLLPGQVQWFVSP